MSALLDRFLPEADPAERARLTQIADGSPGRALRLADEDGTALASLAEDALQASPRLPTARALAIADQASKTDAAFATFMDLLGEGVADRVRAAARDGADRAGRLPLAEWVEVWQAILRLRDETERFNLDKRHAVASSLALLNGS